MPPNYGTKSKVYRYRLELCEEDVYQAISPDLLRSWHEALKDRSLNSRNDSLRCFRVGPGSQHHDDVHPIQPCSLHPRAGRVFYPSAGRQKWQRRIQTGGSCRTGPHLRQSIPANTDVYAEFWIPYRGTPPLSFRTPDTIDPLWAGDRVYR